LDDVHWADDASLALLGFVAEELGKARVLVVATFRDAELPPGHPHLALLDRMKRSSTFKLIEVPPLKPADVERYVQEFSGQRVADELIERIHERTAGNAFFVRETVRSLTWSALREGHLDLSAVVLPQSARDVVRRRVALLEPGARKLLETASAIGECFELPLLRRALSLDTESFLDALDEAEAARLVIRADDQHGVAGTYAFAHALLQETV
jgi:predicted ATPase